jgi:Putative prokaryotic signal transducing protein
VSDPGDRDGDWAVLTVVDPLEAEVLKAALETAGIPAVARQEASGRIIGLTIGSMGEVSLLVPEDRLDEARALIADAHPVDFPESD